MSEMLCLNVVSDIEMGGVTQKMTDTVKNVPILGSSGIQAVAVLQDPTNGQVYGQVEFTQSDDGTVSVSGQIKNIPDKQKRGFHIHEFGDTTNGCTSAGA
jgi:Cu/Zn superoxide dismutase